ncbi:2-alkenal reductase [candidate division KSB1 bacterium]|nr:MAG: 2-alkenal reductase [candidate division KSB1 bacterium]
MKFSGKVFFGFFLGATTVILLMLFVIKFPAGEQTIPAGMAEANASPVADVAESRQNAITRSVALVSPAVVSINVTEVHEYYRANPWANDPFWNHFFPQYDKIQREVKALGSGSLISVDGHIVTNQHVIDSAVKITVTLPGGAQYEAEIVGQDYKSDVAVLKIDGSNFSHIEFGNSDDVLIGEWVIALGNPFGLFDTNAQPTVTVGVVSSLNQDFGRREDERFYEDMIQTDAAINAGNSGGPLANSSGQVIGMNAIIVSGSSDIGTSIGLGFAIPINRVKAVVNDILEHGSVQRDIWQSIQYNDVTPYIAYYLGMNKAIGVIVSDVDRDSPWDRAGLEPEDVILEINSVKIQNSKDMERQKKKWNLKKGDVLQLKVFRNRRIYTAEVK